MVTKDLVGISTKIMEHHLNILPTSHLVKKKRHHFRSEKDRVIWEEIQKLLEVGHIQKVYFISWLSNVALVLKSTGKWRVCMDFHDLNKFHSKDCYPLPHIDQQVDFKARNEFISMMGAYQKYHQIPLAKADKEKVNFIITNETFYYVVIPFWLKNVEVTY